MNIINRPRKIMQLRARLPTLLQLALQPTQNMVEREAALVVCWSWRCWCRSARRRLGCFVLRTRIRNIYDAGGDFVMDDGLVVFADNVDSTFLTESNEK
jgi:hypothetical protein